MAEFLAKNTLKMKNFRILVFGLCHKARDGGGDETLQSILSKYDHIVEVGMTFLSDVVCRL